MKDTYLECTYFGGHGEMSCPIINGENHYPIIHLGATNSELAQE